MAKTTTLEAENPGDSVTFDNTAVADVGINVETHHHTVTVEEGVTTYSVDIRIAGRWVRPADCTDVAEDDAVVLRQVGFDAVKVTCAQAGDVTLTSWKDPR
ncbi:MAG: hypothetical protein EKK55_16415 [Rhodocyclaceae bacterium]|nr:MAG: hypothetical protein EKK55_16415 [Rhodocyclaceae bacterium]